MTDELVEEQRATCLHCGHAIVWYFDRDADAQPIEYGWWYDAESMIEACGGLDGDPVGDLWHEPDPSV